MAEDTLPQKTACEHDFSFAIVVYSYAVERNWGSDARDRIYEDRFVCRKCLETRHINPRTEGNSYTKPIEGTVPK
jgi:hypothetical protein